MHLLVGGHLRGRVAVVGVRRARLRPLREREHEDGAEPPGEPAEHPGADVAAERPADAVAEQVEPVLFVAALRLGEREEDLALLALATAGEVAVDRGLGAFVGEVASPPA